MTTSITSIQLLHVQTSFCDHDLIFSVMGLSLCNDKWQRKKVMKTLSVFFVCGCVGGNENRAFCAFRLNSNVLLRVGRPLLRNHTCIEHERSADKQAFANAGSMSCRSCSSTKLTSSSSTRIPNEPRCCMIYIRAVDIWVDSAAAFPPPPPALM